MTENRPILKLAIKPKNIVLNQARTSEKEVKNEVKITVSTQKLKVKDNVVKSKTTKSVKVVRKPALLTYKIYAEVLSYFQEKYPVCFTIPATPLAIGIYKQLGNETDLINLKISKRQLRLFLYFYCTKPDYIEAVKKGLQRIGL